MKLALISDLHIDINEKYPVIDCLAELLHAGKAAGAVIAGDICEDSTLTPPAMGYLERTAGCPVWYVPGNHDMWSLDFSRRSTREIYEVFASDPRCLVDKKINLHGDNGPVCLVGDIGWYDYSFASRAYGIEELERMRLGERTWQDRLKNQWTTDNRGKMREMVDKLDRVLDKCADKPVIAVTHMLPIADFCVPADREGWGYFNAFLGGAALGQLYERYHVKHAVCGHVHYRRRIRRHGIVYHCPCLGYHSEWGMAGQGGGHEEDVRWQLNDALQWIEV